LVRVVSCSLCSPFIRKYLLNLMYVKPRQGHAQAMPKETSAVRYKLLFNTVLRRLNNGSLSH
jgi:hypothetical protein